MFTKGAVDGLLEVSSRIWDQGRWQPLDDAWRKRILAANDELAKRHARAGCGFRLREQGRAGRAA